MDSEKVGGRVSRMWAKLGRAFEARAYERAESGNLLDCKTAAQIGTLAEACFWQSTGEFDAALLPEAMK